MEKKPAPSEAINRRLLDNARRFFPAAGAPFREGDQVAASLILKPAAGDIVVCLMADRQRYLIGKYYPIEATEPVTRKRRRARRIGDLPEPEPVPVCKIKLLAGGAEIELAEKDIGALYPVIETIHAEQTTSPDPEPVPPIRQTEPEKRPAGRPPKRHAKRTR